MRQLEHFPNLVTMFFTRAHEKGDAPFLWAKLEGRLNEISDALAVASIDEDMSAVTRLGEEYEKVQADLDESYARWETISSAAGVAV